MTIDFTQVSELNAGDLICLEGPGGVVVKGRLAAAPEGSRGLTLGPGLQVRRSFDGYPAQNWIDGRFNLHVVERARPPLYVNSDKTEPDFGDVAAPSERGPNDVQTWHFHGQWCDRRGYGFGRDELPARLLLLVDGRTGQVVP